jgi:hypothetical protein
MIRSTGDSCTAGIGDMNAPDGCTATEDGGILCDCAAYPEGVLCVGSNPPPPNCVEGASGLLCYDDPPWSSGDPEDPGGDTGGPDPVEPDDDNPNPGPDDPSDDDDPDTPDHPGTGSGDITGPGGIPDGQRDIDCDPSSNPECAYTGSGTGSEACDAQPACSGDPVQCAILYQQWAAMCYGKVTDLTYSFDCNTPPTCEGDPLGCAQLKFDWQNICSMHAPELAGTPEIWNDPTLMNNNPFDAENQEVVDVEGEIDMGGFLGGGACPLEDVAIEYGDLGTLEIPFSLFCSLLPILAFGVMLAGVVHSASILQGAL